MTSRIRRRRFLELSAAASLLPLASACPAPATADDAGVDAGAGPPTLDPDDYDGGARTAFDAASLPLDATAFALGVQCGSPTSEGARMWTKTTTARVGLAVWRDTDEAGQVVLVFDDEVGTGDHACARVDVSGLAPATWYQYAFFTLDDDGAKVGRSEIGRVRTAFPDDWMLPLTLACATCTAWDHQPWESLSTMASHDFDAFIHLGDMSYNDGAVTPDEYAAKWDAALADPGYRAILPRAGIYATWDDHEITNNLNPTTIDEDQLRAAKDAYFAHVPVDRRELTDVVGGTTFMRTRWGHTAEIIVLDSRTLRTPSSMTDDPTAYLGAPQTEFLKEALKDSPCHFKIVVNSVPITRMPELWAFANDRWQGYLAQRNDLLLFLEDEGIENVWFLAGDFHMGFVGRVEVDGYARRFWEIAVGPTGNLGNPLGFLAEQDEYRESVFPAGQFTYGRGKLAGTLLTFDPARDAVRIRFLAAGTGEVLYDEELVSAP